MLTLLGADGSAVIEGWANSVEDSLDLLATHFGSLDLKLKLDLEVAQLTRGNAEVLDFALVDGRHGRRVANLDDALAALLADDEVLDQTPRAYDVDDSRARLTFGPPVGLQGLGQGKNVGPTGPVGYLHERFDDEQTQT